MSNFENVFSNTAKLSPKDALLDIFGQVGRMSPLWDKDHPDEPFIATTAVGAPHPNVLPLELNDRLQQVAQQKYGPAMLGYGAGGFEAAMKNFLVGRGLNFEDSLLVTTSGGMEAINLGIRALINPGDKVIVEAPGFTGTFSGLKEAGANVIELNCGENGLTAADLEKIFTEQKPKLIVLMPDFQNPTGVVMPLAERKAIAELLKKHNVFAIEDGAYSELGFSGDRLPALQSFAPKNVLYCTSFSKILWPAIRTGAMVADKRIAQVVAQMKFNFNMVTSPEAVAKVEAFLTLDGGRLIEDRIIYLRATYKERYDSMTASMQKQLMPLGFTWREPKGGMFIYAKGPQILDTGDLASKAIQNGMAYVPGDKCYYDQTAAPKNELRINFASTPTEQSGLAMRRLAQVVEAALAK